MIYEMELKFRRTRFVFGDYNYPLHLVCFEGGNNLGYFNSEHFQIGIHKSLIYSAKTKVLKDILRHELAHLITFIRFGPHVSAHGKEFREVCHSYGWRREVSSGKIDLQSANASLEEEIGQEKIIEKVKKLLALANSDNIHEAETAALKANQLLVQHHLTTYGLDNEENDELYVREVLRGKRASGKYKAICDILSTFCVYPILNHSKSGVTLEVTGRRNNVLIAEYIGQFLNQELERLYQESDLRGIHQKRSFMLGVAEGYANKHKQYQDQMTPQNQRALVAIKDQLTQRIGDIYPHLKRSYSSQEFSLEALMLGKRSGEQLSIRKGVQSDPSQTLLLS